MFVTSYCSFPLSSLHTRSSGWNETHKSKLDFHLCLFLVHWSPFALLFFILLILAIIFQWDSNWSPRWSSQIAAPSVVSRLRIAGNFSSCCEEKERVAVKWTRIRLSIDIAPRLGSRSFSKNQFASLSDDLKVFTRSDKFQIFLLLEKALRFSLLRCGAFHNDLFSSAENLKSTYWINLHLSRHLSSQRLRNSKCSANRWLWWRIIEIQCVMCSSSIINYF
jgi:hypothetical protein